MLTSSYALGLRRDVVTNSTFLSKYARNTGQPVGQDVASVA